MSQPICTICKQSGFGVQFPLLPKSDGFRFGTICDECDEKKSLDN